MGVWIEIAEQVYTVQAGDVTPCVGVWIEMLIKWMMKKSRSVTPCVGVWIEISHMPRWQGRMRSLPAWECGLKFS